MKPWIRRLAELRGCLDGNAARATVQAQAITHPEATVATTNRTQPACSQATASVHAPTRFVPKPPVLSLLNLRRTSAAV